ncbi:MAG: diphthine synthase [Candidatus Pacearchaeota archaeon]
MFNIIGLGLNEKGYSREAYDAIVASDEVYIDNYTVDFPYDFKKLEKQFPKKKLLQADRDLVESDYLVKNSKNMKISLLVYGNPLMATTHVSLIDDLKKNKVKVNIIHGASILDAVSETGLQTYKFGKIASIPKHEAESFKKIIKDNQKIKAHSLVLVDIGLDLRSSLDRVSDFKSEKIILCSQLGNLNSQIFYDKISNLKSKKIKYPYCFIIPGELHFFEKELLENLKKGKD